MAIASMTPNVTPTAMPILVPLLVPPSDAAADFDVAGAFVDVDEAVADDVEDAGCSIPAIIGLSRACCRTVNCWLFAPLPAVLLGLTLIQQDATSGQLSWMSEESFVFLPSWTSSRECQIGCVNWRSGTSGDERGNVLVKTSELSGALHQV